MDPSTPVAGRTRSKHAIYYKEWHEKIKGKKEKGNGYADSESESEFSGGGGGGGSGSGRGKRKKEVALGKQTRGKKNWGLRVDSGSLDISDDGCQEMGVEESDDVVVACSEEVDDDDVEFLGFDGWDPRSPKKLKKSGDNLENAISIEVDSSDQDEVDVIGEERGEGGYSFGNSSLKTGSCSKVGSLKGAKFGPVNVDKVVSSRHEIGGKYIVELNGGKSSERVQLELEDLEESLNVNDLQSDDAEDELESSSHDDSDELEESSDEDNDDADDEDFRVGDQILEISALSESEETSASEEGEEVDGNNDDDDFRVGDQILEVSVSSESEETSAREERKEVDGNNVTKRVSIDGEGKGKEEDKNEDEGNSSNISQGVNCVARRTRSCSGSKFKEQITKLGTVSRPLCINEKEDRKEQDSSCGDDNGGDGHNHDNQTKHREKKINSTEGNVDRVNCVARRTRSRSGSKFKEQITKLGTFCRPLCINQEEDRKEQDSSCGDDNGGDGHNYDIQTKHREKKINSTEGNVDSFLANRGVKYEEEIGKSNQRKRVCAPKKLDFVNILLDSILNKSNGIVEELVNSRGGILDQEISPPLIATWKFLYPVKDSNSPEEPEDEKENNPLWNEFDFALRSSEIDSTDYLKVDNEDSTTPDVKSDPASLCSRGHHQFIINEEVGLICQFCSCMGLEIKYISPPFDKQAWRRLQNKDREMDNYTFNELQFQESGCDSQLGSDPHVHSKGTVWDLVPGFKNNMFRHQREGFEFIWKIIAGGVNLHELKSINFNGGSGCVISHAPGTGKTRLILAFLQAYMQLYPTCKPIIIAPRSMLLTWEEQCKIWNIPMPFHILNNNELSGKENMAVLKLLKEAKYQGRSVDMNRMAKIYSWVQGKSILGLSYRLFERIVWKGEVANEKGKTHKVWSRVDSEIRKILLELPGLVVLDEGHTPRNDHSLMWKALSKIQTEKRIILSGTPFQNNFDELYNTLCLVRPKFADTILNQSRWCNAFQRKRGRKISAARDKWASLTNSIGKEADDKLPDLRAMIDPFVHLHKGNILQESLPGLRDSVVMLKPSHFQKSLLEGLQGSKNKFELEYMVSLISAHPSLLLVCPSEKEKSIVEKDKLKKDRLNPDAGVKTKFITELIRLSGAMKERVLVFSQWTKPLKLIRAQLKSHFNWIEGKELLYMDGKRDVKERQSSINVFNDITSEARVLLASIRACSEGINLIGASRVVLLDVLWNPSTERQAISRAYRLGQKRVVHIYHLITSCTIEREKFYRQVEKDRISGLVFSTTQNDCNGQKISDTVSDDKILEELVQHDKLKDMFEKIIYQPKESDLIETFGLVSPVNI